jgi:hypothetical protein
LEAQNDHPVDHLPPLVREWSIEGTVVTGQQRGSQVDVQVSPAVHC